MKKIQWNDLFKIPKKDLVIIRDMLKKMSECENVIRSYGIDPFDSKRFVKDILK